MKLTLKEVEEVFNEAKEQNSKYVLVTINAVGYPEIIAVPQESMDSKLKYYLGIYKEQEDGTLRHGMNNAVIMESITHANVLI